MFDGQDDVFSLDPNQALIPFPFHFREIIVDRALTLSTCRVVKHDYSVVVIFTAIVDDHDDHDDHDDGY